MISKGMVYSFNHEELSLQTELSKSKTQREHRESRAVSSAFVVRRAERVSPGRCAYICVCVCAWKGVRGRLSV